MRRKIFHGMLSARTMTLVLIALLFGVLATVLLAWSCAIWRVQSPWGGTIIQTMGGYVEEKHGLGVVEWSKMSYLSDRYARLFEATVAFGWPCPALAFERRMVIAFYVPLEILGEVESPARDYSEFNPQTVNQWAIKIPRILRRSTTYYYSDFLPLRPLWFGLIIDVLAWGFVPWMLWRFTPIVVRRWRQWLADRRGRCRKCGYILFGITSKRCPECGTEIPVSTDASAEKPNAPPTTGET